MLRRNDGYFLVEQLLSLYTLLLICLFFLPLYMELAEHTRQLQLKKQAVQILYEELNSKRTGDQPLVSYPVFMNDIEYDVFWNTKGEQKEACVKVEDSEWCRILE